MITQANFLEMSQSEKNSILLMHESLFPIKPISEEELTFESVILGITEDLNFHKKIHQGYIMNLDIGEGLRYITKVREEYLQGLFSENQVVLENYKNNFPNIIAESTIDLLEEINRFNEFLIESLIYEWNPLSWAYDKAKKGVQWVGDKVKQGWKWIKEKGISWLMGGIRKGLYSWGGAAVQTFLAGPWTAGVGNVILVVVWGAMLVYDLYLGFGKGEWNWGYILIDVIAILTTGPGGKIVHGIFKSLGLLGKGVPLKTVIQKVMNSKNAAWFGNMLKSIVKGIGKVGEVMLQGANWVASKLGFSAIKNWTTKAKSSLESMVSTITQTTAGQATKNVTQNVVKKGTQKLTQLGQKTGQKLTQLGQKTGQSLSALSPNVKALGNVALAGGSTYGINAALGGDNRVFGGAFVNDDEELLASLNNQPVEYTDEDLP